MNLEKLKNFKADTSMYQKLSDKKNNLKVVGKTNKEFAEYDGPVCHHNKKVVYSDGEILYLYYDGHGRTKSLFQEINGNEVDFLEKEEDFEVFE